MITLGIHDGHNATVCLMRDGEIAACIPEERLTREKNYCGIPANAIGRCLEVAGVAPEEVDAVGVAGLVPPVHSLKEITGPKGFRGLYSRMSPLFPKSFLRSSACIGPAVAVLSKLRNRQEVRDAVAAAGIRADITFYDHHTLHTLSAYGCSPWYADDEKTLVLSCDGAGDGVCATVNVGQGGTNGGMKRLHTVSHFNSLGELYARTTQFLGMDPTSDEYKVMGLAAYANPKYAAPAYSKLKDCITVERDGLGLRNNTRYTKFRYLKFLEKTFGRDRFDCVSWAVQQLTETTLAEWVANAVRRTGIRRVVLSGGIFMNVKANHVLLSLPEVEALWVLPSCSDDSLSIGAAMHAAMDRGFREFRPLKQLYFGPAYGEREIEAALAECSNGGAAFNVEKSDAVDEKVGRSLARGNIVGRFAGRMEWGSRALGNRSILADPRDMRSISRINRAIKKREFWMPYCPSMIEERAGDYFHTDKGYRAHYMIMAFPTTARAQDDIPASMHVYDRTIRPQVVTRDWNPGYHRLIRAFEEETGVGAVLNTSFNLTGYPIVCSPEDALDVFVQSDLDAVAIGNFYVTRKPV